MSIRITTLGSLRIVVDGAEHQALRAQKLRCALFLYLAVERSATREQLVGIFWPERSPDRARHTLSQALYELRGTIGDGVVESRGDRVVVAEDVAVDAVQLERAVEEDAHDEAIELYGGPFLDGVYLADTPGFEDWVDQTRARLARRCRAARRAVIERRLAEGDLEAALAAARQGTELDPLDDEAQHRVIELLARTGQRSAALRQYEQYAQLLARELEVEPLDQTRALVERIRAGEIDSADGMGVEAPVAAARPPRVRETQPAYAADGQAPPAPATVDGDTAEHSPPSLFDDLKRRKVFRVALLYIVVAYGVIEAGDLIFDALSLPEWTFPLLVSLVLLAFPLALVLAWAFDITPDGIRPAHHARGADGRPDTPAAVRVGFAVITLAVLAGGFLAFQRLGADGPTDAALADRGLDPKRIAVLYFDDHSADGSLADIANGLTEELIHQLSQVPGLSVASRNGVKQFRGREDVALDSIVTTLRAGTLVEGSVARSGDRVRVTVQMIDAATNSHITSDVVERPDGDLLTLVEDVAGEVSRLLRRQLGEEIRLRRMRAGADVEEAWRLVQAAERERDTAGELRTAGEVEAARRALARADSLLAEAQKLDQDWLEPSRLRAWIAVDRLDLAAAGPEGSEPAHDPPAAIIDEGLRHADRVVERAREPARGLEVRGILRYRKWDLGLAADTISAGELLADAERDLRIATRQDASLARGWAALSDLLRRNGQFVEAKVAADRAYQADAYLERAPELVFALAQAHLDVDQEHAIEATRLCRQGLERFGHNSRYRTAFRGCLLTTLAWVADAPADADEAWRLARETVETSPPQHRDYNRAVTRLLVAATLARAGLQDSARAVIRRVRAGDWAPDVATSVAYHEAGVRVLLGEPDRALALLREYLEARPHRRSYVAEDWLFAELRDREAFRELVGR